MDLQIIKDDTTKNVPTNFPGPTWIIIPDRNIGVRCWYECEYVMEFRVFDVAQEWDPGTPENPTWIILNSGHEVFNFEEWEKAEWEIRGGLKWDGCLNWETNPSCMAHACGPSMIKNITAIFTIVYAVGKRNLDLLGDEVPPLPEGFVEIIEPQ